jgi:hypothetical protein
MPEFTPDNIESWQLNRDAQYSNKAIQLTPLTTYRPVPSRSGSAFLKDRVTLDENRSFNAYFTFQISEPGTTYGLTGADGLVFTIQPSANTVVSPGGMGYQSIAPSVGIEFDTWRNDESHILDPDHNHVGLDINGDLQSVTKATPPGLLDENLWHVWVDYNGAAKNLELRMNRTNERPGTALMTDQRDLKQNIEQNVFIGFTAGTGWAWENHDIKSFYFSNQYVPGGIDTKNNTYIEKPRKGVQVLNGTEPASGAMVYRLPAGKTKGGELLRAPDGSPLLTDQHGYLQGQATLSPGDRLLAIAPITTTERYTLYYTNGTPTDDGLLTDIVEHSGLKELTVSREHPLLLFNLHVSLEWDAHTDSAFLERMRNDLKLASKDLYDFTDGQVALGKVTLHQGADHWAYSDVVVHATNDLRPFADQGGIVVTDTVDLKRPAVSYSPGQVHIGPMWNRKGEPGKNFENDWSRILAHELSHYLLYQEDSYLGFTDEEALTIVDSCTGSAMGDVYKSDNTEFVFDQNHWDQKCGNTLANTTLQRHEWDTLKLWYPDLIIPQSPLAGPELMPFNLTDVEVRAPSKLTEQLGNPTITINYAKPAVSSTAARAFLIRDDKYMLDLGRLDEGFNRVLARGAVRGDRLCILDRLRSQFGCNVLAGVDTQIGMKEDQSWTPVIQITAVTSTTYDISVSSVGAETRDLHARLFPEFGPATAPISLTRSGNVYQGRLELPQTQNSETFEFSMLGLQNRIQVWVDEPTTDTNPRREVIISYSVGGSPGWARPGGAPILRRAGGSGPIGATGAGGAGLTGAGGSSPVRSTGAWATADDQAHASLVSPDGQIVVDFSGVNATNTKLKTVYTIQGMEGLPPIPHGKKVVGRGYNLVTSDQQTQPPGSISFQYFDQDLIAAEVNENELQIHHWDGKQWQVLRSARNIKYNFISARIAGPGIYALMGGTTVPTTTSFDPGEATTDITTTLTITGSNFLRPLKVELVGQNLLEPLAVELKVESSSPITITAQVPPGLPQGMYNIRVTNGDQNTSSEVGIFGLYPPKSATSCFADWFGSGPNRWQVSGDWGIVALPDGEQAMTDSPAGNYRSAPATTPRRTTSITSRVFDLSECSHPVLAFRHDYVFAKHGNSEDLGNVELSLDQGATWVTLASYSGGRIYGSSEQRSQDAPLTEWLDTDWKDARLDLSRYTGMAQVRFTLSVDQYGADRGWIIDDIAVHSRSEKYQILLPFVQLQR